MTNLKLLEQEISDRLNQAADVKAVEEIKIAYLGRKGMIACLFQELKSLPSSEKPEAGKLLNALKIQAEELFQKKLTTIGSSEKLDSDFDETLPGAQYETGRLHPITLVIREITSIFTQLGFEIVDGREVETEFYNFTALNIPLDHPSRDSFDTFYLNQGCLLRSQTSTVQIREMQKRKPPLRILAPGRVYRPDAVDASHSFMFHQIEGLWVDDRATFSDLKGILHLFLRKLFGKDVQMRFRPHFFPFTEPSVEVDVKWKKGWLELLGAGQVDPAVFSAVGYDTKKVQGFAFGLGVERIAMLKYGVNDIRLFFENGLRFLKQF